LLQAGIFTDMFNSNYQFIKQKTRLLAPYPLLGN
jgi:hypothetical protein